VTDPGNGKREDTGERSDLFSLGRSVEQIPDVEEVLLPPEEQRRLRVRRMVTLAAAAVATLVLLFFAWRFMHARTVQEAVLAAGDGGRVSALERARDLAVADGRPCLAARLNATLALAGAPADLESVASAITAAEGSSGDTLLEARLAQTYLALARFDGPGALTAEGSLRPFGTYAAEVAHAKALTGLAVGDLEHARTLIAVAVQKAPNGARHLALAALIGARTDPGAAFAGLEHAPEAATHSPALTIVRARLDLLVGDATRAAAQAQAVLDGEEATPQEQAWARLVLARQQAEAGNLSAARQQAQALLDAGAPGDEAFALRLSEALLLAGDPAGATQARAHLASGYSTDPAWRARVTAWNALDAGHTAEAQEALTLAGTSAEASWLRGRVAEALGRLDSARAAYTEALPDVRMGPRAALSLSLLERRAGRAAEAVAAIRASAAAEPTHPLRAAALSEALTLAEQAEEAASVAEAALHVHAGDASLLEALGHAKAASGQHEPARVALAAAAATHTDDVELWADLAREARLTNHGDEARSAAESALALNASHQRSLRELLTLELDENHREAAAALLERLDATDANGTALERERARYLVASGAGVGGVRALRRALRHDSRDPSLRLALAYLYLQAEMWAPAQQAFQSAGQVDASPLEVATGMGLAQIGMSRLPPALDSLETARGLAGDAGSARVEVLEGAIELFQRHVRPARQAAERALALDANDAEAHLLLAKVRRITGGEVDSELRAALAAPGTPPDALARLARTLGANEEGCALAQRFRRAAPAGDGARDMRDLMRDCPR